MLAAGAAGLLAAAAYLAQFMTLAPWDPDAGLLLGYIHQVASGERAHFDFVDVWGPLHWLLPALFYEAFGERVWGVRVLLLLLKLASVFLTFKLVRQLAHPFHAALAALWVTILLGMPWPSLQMPYSFHQAHPLLLLTMILLLARPLPRASWNIAAAGITAMLVVWIKANAGLFLLAAGLLYGFCWTTAAPKTDGTNLARWQGSFRAAQWLGLTAYALVFGAFMREHFDRFFFLYLAVPLALALGAAALRVAEARRGGEPIGAPLRAWAILLTTFVGLSAAFALSYFGIGPALDYAAEQAKLLSSFSRAARLPPLGEPGPRVGFNEWYWLQLPWLVTATYAAWWATAARRAAPETRSALHGLFLFFALASFVIYSRADEPHVLQAVLAGVPVLFVYLSHLESVFPAAWRTGLRVGLAALALAYGSTLFFGPDPDVPPPRGWSQASMRPIHYRPYPHHRHSVPPETQRRIDQAVDEAAHYLDEISEDGSVVWILTNQEMLNFLSRTRPAGGRYKYVFYLIKTGLIAPVDFEALMPETVRSDLLADPPRIVVTSARGKPKLIAAMPELEPVLASRYRKDRRFGRLQVLVRND